MAKKLNSENSVRVRQIQEWLLQGHIVTDICRNIMKAWAIEQEDAIKLIADAFEDFNHQVGKDWDKTKAYHVQLRLNLYRKALEAKQLTLALRILNDLGKLEDIYPE
jgi:hypothetical protein